MKILVGGSLVIVTALIALFFGIAHNPPDACTSTLSDLSAAVTALGGAGQGEVICLADGTYGTVTLDQARSSDVTLRAEHPGDAHLGTVTFSGPASHYRLSEMQIAGIIITGGADTSPNHLIIDRNLLVDGAYGLIAESPTYPVPGGCCITGNTVPITDLTIRNNIFGAVTVEDALRIDGVTRAAVIHNEFTGIVPPNADAHTDCIQTVWGATDLTFSNNYIHDNDCQPIFVGKDGDVTNFVAEQNLIVRDRNASGAALFEQLSWINPKGAIVRHNTFVGLSPDSPIGTTDLIMWSGANHANGNPASAPASGAVLDHNVFSALHLNDYDATPSPSTGIFVSTDVMAENHNVISAAPWLGDRALGTCSVFDETPAFADPATDDYRVTVAASPGCASYSAGITWIPADQNYGPGS